MFTRTTFTDLSRWHRDPRRKPLIIRGARQVGKSTLVRQWTKEQGLPLFEINLERHVKLDAAFAKLDIPELLAELSFSCGRPVNTGGVLFLDEIQATPHALRALRYLWEERPDLPVLAAGSLLEFAIDAADFSMPVGRVRHLHLGPLGFAEFASALGESDLATLLRTWVIGAPFPVAAHQRLTLLLRDYLLVGGMPEAVAAFADQRQLADAHAIHLSIFDTYRDDFGKYAGRVPLDRLRRVFDHVPATVGEKFRFSRAIPEARAAEVRKALDLLATAGIVHLVRHSDANGLPLGAEADDTAFKPLFLDIGLMNAACGVRTISLEALHDNKFVNEGRMAEQFAGQNLLAGQERVRRPELHYWLREGRTGNAEVDYLVEHDARVIPVEVKAGASGGMKSLQQFMALKASPFAVRLDLNPPSSQQVEALVQTPQGMRSAQYTLHSLPLYLADQVERLVLGNTAE